MKDERYCMKWGETEEETGRCVQRMAEQHESKRGHSWVKAGAGSGWAYNVCFSVLSQSLTTCVHHSLSKGNGCLTVSTFHQGSSKAYCFGRRMEIFAATF